jgi:hypothetical protein
LADLCRHFSPIIRDLWQVSSAGCAVMVLAKSN